MKHYKNTSVGCRSVGDRLIGSLVGLVGLLWMPADLYAYIDPGTTGMLSQLLYVLFYGALGLFLYLLRYLKKTGASIKDGLWKFLKIKKPHSST